MSFSRRASETVDFDQRIVAGAAGTMEGDTSIFVWLSLTVSYNGGSGKVFLCDAHGRSADIGSAIAGL